MTEEELSFDAVLAADEQEYSDLVSAGDNRRDVYAIAVMSGARLTEESALRRQLHQRAFEAANFVPAKEGLRFFVMGRLGQEAFRLGDLTTAWKSHEVRRQLAVDKSPDEVWVERNYDVIIPLNDEGIWRELYLEAAQYGDVALARNLVSQAKFEKPPSKDELDIIVLSILKAAGDFDEAGELASSLFQKVRNTTDEERDEIGITETDLLVAMIEAKANMQENFGAEWNLLRLELAYEQQSISSHQITYYFKASEFSTFSPEYGRMLVHFGRAMNDLYERDVFDRAYPEAWICEDLGMDDCVLDVAQDEERLVRELKLELDGAENFILYLLGDVASIYAGAGDYASTDRLIKEVSSKSCVPRARVTAFNRLVKEGELEEAERWLLGWLECQLDEDPNYAAWWGHGGNIWTAFSTAYGDLSRQYTERGDIARAREYARLAYGFAIEADRSWGEENRSHRRRGMAEAYGSAIGAFAVADSQ
ncbi:hypothetical protein [Parvularcula marina]|nr:hypothetical protein [Parvularcula marina]